MWTRFGIVIFLAALFTILGFEHGVVCNNNSRIVHSRHSRHFETEDTIIIETPKSEQFVEEESEGHQKYPHLAAIMRDGKQICAGALLDKVHVISSAYCIPNITSEEVGKLQIGIGYQTFGDGGNEDVRRKEGPYYVRRVTKVIMDRSFYYQSLQTRNSLVIYRIDAPITYNDYVEPLELPRLNINITGKHIRQLPPIKSGMLSGFRKGLDNSGKETFYLKGVTLRVHSFEECRKEYLNSNKMDEVFCASTALSNSCLYALGSPFTNKRHGRNMLIGIRERNCHFPNVFTKVEYFLPWIQKNLRHKRS